MISTSSGLDARAAEHRRTAATLHWYLMFPVVVVALLLGPLTTWLIPIVIVVGAVLVALAPRNVEGKVLSVLGARPVEAADQPRLANLVDGLCLSHGITEPSLYVLDDDGANALVVAGPEAGHLVITTGLLDVVDRIALEGVVAALLARLRNGDAFVGTRAAWFVCGRSLLENGPTRSGARRGLTTMGSGFRSTRLAKVIGPNLDLVGDLDATGLTRYPPGLRDALIAMGKRGTAVGPATWGGSHLWLASPFQPGDDDPLTNAFDLHDPLIHRIDLLGEQ